MLLNPDAGGELPELSPVDFPSGAEFDVLGTRLGEAQLGLLEQASEGLVLAGSPGANCRCARCTEIVKLSTTREVCEQVALVTENKKSDHLEPTAKNTCRGPEKVVDVEHAATSLGHLVFEHPPPEHVQLRLRYPLAREKVMNARAARLRGDPK